MTLKMLIADDEPKIRRGIAECIDWATWGIEIVGLARNGLDLIQQCREKRPDLCLVDICMRQMGGLEAIDAIRQFLPESRFIIISGSEEFKHARHAISSNAAAYLLKPLNQERMVQTVKETAERIRREQKDAKILEFAKSRVMAEKSQMFNGFMKKWIQKQYTDEEVEFSLNSLKLNEKGSYILLLIDHPEFPVTVSTQTEIEERTFALHRTFQKSLKMNNEVLWASLTSRRLFGIVKLAADELFEPMHKELLESAGEPAGIRLHFVSRMVHSLREEFQGAYEVLTQALEAEMHCSPVVKSVEQMIRNDYRNKGLSLTQVAQSRNINPQYLSRTFKRQTGLSFSEFLIRTRINKASLIIRSTDISIREISDSVGYSSHHYFSREFKKITGFTPTEYRMNKEVLSRFGEHRVQDDTIPNAENKRITVSAPFITDNTLRG